jgi:hypothetical protein
MIDNERILELTQIATDGLFGQFSFHDDKRPSRIVFHDYEGHTDILYMTELGSYIRMRGSEHGNDSPFITLIWLRKNADIGQFGWDH